MVKERQLRLVLVYSYLCNRTRICRSHKFLIDDTWSYLVSNLEFETLMLLKLGVKYPINDFMFNDYFLKSVKISTRRFDMKLFDYIINKIESSTRIISVIDYLQHLREAETVLARAIQADKEKVHEIWYDLVDLIFDDPDYVHKIHTLIKD